jgi:hypothetical protein
VRVIRKISIGSESKEKAMHYSVGQSVYGGHEVHSIKLEKDNSYGIYIKNEKEEVMPWKNFNSNMAISLEYDLEY